MAKGKPTGTIKRASPTPFRPKSLQTTKTRSMPTSQRSVGTKIPSAPKPRSVAKAPSLKKNSPVARSVARPAKSPYTKPTMAKKSGVMTAVKTAASVASYFPGLGGLASRAVSAVLPDGTPVYSRRKRRRGLTYSDIKGATRVLKLVKKFAPPGSRAKLRVRSPKY